MLSDMNAMIGVLLTAALINLFASSPPRLPVPHISAQIAWQAAKDALTCDAEAARLCPRLEIAGP